MTPDKSLLNLFNEALEKEEAGERARFLDEACGADVTLRERVEMLLRAHDEAGGFFSQPSPNPGGGIRFFSDLSPNLVSGIRFLSDPSPNVDGGVRFFSDVSPNLGRDMRFFS